MFVKSTEHSTARTRLPSAEQRERDAVERVFESDVVTAEMVENIIRTGPALPVENPISAERWKDMAARFDATGSLEKEDTFAIRDMALEARKLHRSLHRQYRDSDYKDPELNQGLEQVRLFLQALETPRRAYIEASARVNLEALSGTALGAPGVVAAYAAWAQLSGPALTELTAQMQKLESGGECCLQGGNRVEAVHRERLWQAKMELLDEAIESAKAGQPVEINAQYFELTSGAFVGRLAEAARAGCPVRINVDPSRLRSGGDSAVRIDDGPRKLRALMQLGVLPNVDMGVSVFPVVKELGSLSELMHRKFLRVGEKVLLGGMNANQGSGENVDCGYLIEGPAARRLTEKFARDLELSRHSTLHDIYGVDDLDEFFESKDVSLTAHGVLTLLDSISGPTPAGVSLDKKPSYTKLEKAAKDCGLVLSDLLELSAEELKAQLDAPSKRRKPMVLSKTGKRLIAHAVEAAFVKFSSADNRDRLEVSLPEGKPVGKTKIAVGDLPVEREALLLHAISTAEEFIYIPTFVITRPVARAIAKRKEQLAEQGRELDVRVLADPGIYPYGGTPNEHGVLPLEDADIPVRWALLPRTNREHDRKVHAKQILTDKMEFMGSTNLSSKGMRDNWEMSAVVVFDEDAPDSIAARESGKRQFLKMWEHESFELDTRAVAEKRLVDKTDAPDYEARVEEARRSALRTLLLRIQHFEHETADWMQQKAQDPKLAAQVRELELTGLAPGYALLEAVEGELGTELFYGKLKQLESYRKLEKFRRDG